MLALALGMLCLAAPAAMAKRTVPQNFFGTVFDGRALVAPPVNQEGHFAVMAATGVESARVTFPWTGLEPVKNKFDFERTDRTVLAAAKHRVDLLPAILYTPYWARVQKRNAYSPPKRNSYFTALMRQLIRRYGSNGSFWKANPDVPKRPIRYWQIWNEPNNTIERYWDAPRGSKHAWPRGYASLLEAANTTIHKEDRQARTVLAGITGVAWRDLRLLYQYKGGKSFDVAALQVYPETVANEVRALKAMRAEMVRARHAKARLWVTEVAFPASKGKTKSIFGQRQQTDDGMARNLNALYARLARGRKSLALDRVYWYTWASRYGENKSAFDFSGLLGSENGIVVDKAQPALAAYRFAARRAQGCVKTVFGVCERSK